MVCWSIYGVQLVQVAAFTVRTSLIRLLSVNVCTCNVGHVMVEALPKITLKFKSA